MRWPRCTCRWYPPFLVKLNRFQRLACKLLGLPPPKVPDTRKFVQLPDIAEHFENDAVFGVQRLAGLNPVNLRGLDADDPRCDIISGVPGATAALQAGAPSGPLYNYAPITKPPEPRIRLRAATVRSQGCTHTCYRSYYHFADMCSCGTSSHSCV